METPKIAETLIRQTLKDGQTHPTKNPRRNVFRMSGCGDCENALVLDWLYPAEERPGANLLRPAFGTLWHATIRGVMKRAGLKLYAVEKELKVIHRPRPGDPKIVILGHCDGVFKVGRLRTTDDIAHDIKTCGGLSFRLQQENLSRLYRDQLMMYMHTLGLKRGVIVLVNLEGGYATVPVRYQRKAVQEIFARLKRVYDARRKKVFGEREYVKGRFPCTVCRHARTCWNLPPGATQRGDVLVDPMKLTPERRRLYLQIVHFRNVGKHVQATVDSHESKTRDAALKLLKSLGKNRIIVPGVVRITRATNGAIRITGDEK